MNDTLIVVLIFGFLGLLFLTLGIYFEIKRKNVLKEGIEAKGLIINKEKKTYTFVGANNTNSIYFFYTIEYYDHLKNKIIEESNFGVQEELNIGDEIDIIYKKSNSKEFNLKNNTGQNLYIIIIVLGGIFTLISIGFICF